MMAGDILSSKAKVPAPAAAEGEGAGAIGDSTGAASGSGDGGGGGCLLWTDGDLVFANSTCFSKELMVTVDPAQSRNKGAARRRQRQPRGRKVELLRELRMRRSELGLARLHLS